MAKNNSGNFSDLYSLKSYATHSEMKKINLNEFVRENCARDLSDENKSAGLIEQKLGGILDRAGPHIREIDFNHSWPVISQTILENIKEKCFQLTKLEMGWVRINADILPLLEHVAPQLEEFSLEESTWIGENSRQNEAKASQFLPKMHRLRRLNLRKFGGPLDDLVKIEGSQLEYLDVSEARQLDADTLVNFLNQNNQLICLHLCPMPRQCLQLVAASTTSAINVPTAFLGFTKQEIRERQRYKEENGNIPLRRPKKGKTADLQTLIGQIGKMPKLRTLWLGYIPYTSHFLDISPIGNATELKHLHLKECMSLDGNSLKSMLGGILKDQLRQLSLLNCQRLEEFSALSLCTCLTQLDIEKSKALNDEALKGLAQHGRLRIVRINECPKVHDDGILSIVSKCTALKELELIKCSGISCDLFSNAKAFSNSDRFERLSLSGCETITNNSIKQLICSIKLNKLQQLDLSQNMNLDDSVLEMLKGALEKAKNLNRESKLVLTVCCTGTGINRQLISKYEPLMEIVFY